MNYIKTKLPNGLRLITVPMPSMESVTVTVWVRAGTRFEEKRVNGIAHFLEHMAFKGSYKRPTAKDISETVDSIGGEFNAGTSKEWINFYIKARNTHLTTVFDVLSDMVLNPLLKEEEIEREKGVIIEEIAMHEDTPAMKIGDIFESLIFDKSPLSWEITGTPESVRKIKRNDVLRYVGDHYYSENMLLTVAGGVREKEVIELAREYFKSLKSGPKYKSKFKNFNTEQLRPRFRLKSKKAEQAHLILGFRGNPKGHRERFAEAVLASILGGGMSSRLFLEVRERRGLAYAVRTSVDHYIDTGYFATYAGLALSKIEEAIAVILEEHNKIRNSKFDREAGYSIRNSELRKAKEYLKGHLALALEDTRDVNNFFGEEELLLGKVMTPEEVFEKVDKVTNEEVITVAKKFFKPERLNLSIIGPYKSEDRFVKLIL